MKTECNMSLPSLNTVKASSVSHSPRSRPHYLLPKPSSAKMDDYSDRPECFSSTLQECAFVLTATLATAQTSLFGGLIVCITSHIAEDLGMSVAEVTWLSAAQASASLSGAFSFSQASFQRGPNRLQLLSSIAKSRVVVLADLKFQVSCWSFLTILRRGCRPLLTTFGAPLWYDLLLCIPVNRWLRPQRDLLGHCLWSSRIVFCSIRSSCYWHSGSCLHKTIEAKK
jgi:hypothetical protein